MSLIEWIAVAFSITYVVLLARENAWAWPAGIIGSLLTLVVVFDARLYLDSGLYVCYVILGAYGWYLWVYGDKDQPVLPIVHSPPRTLGLMLLSAAIGTLGLGYWFGHHTDADLPYWDAFTTTFSLVGTWMQARKHLENWLLWLVVDGVYVGVYAYKGLFAFSLLSGIYLLLASYAYVQWVRRYRAQPEA
jgi:nicotinamide mononucleotide transporter